MRIYSFASGGTPQMAFNAAPVAPAGAPAVFAGVRTTGVNPFASAQEASTPRLAQISRDTFTRGRLALQGASDVAASAPAALPALPGFNEIQAQISALTDQELQSRVERHLSGGSFDDVRQAAGILNVAGKTGRLAFGTTGNCIEAKFGFRRHMSAAVAELGAGDHVAGLLEVQRAMRHVNGFQ